MKYWQTKQFKKLNQHWREILKADKFPEIESPSGHLKHSWDRGIAFQNREAIAQFFSDLGFMLAHDKEIPARDRAILERYAKGEWIRDIRQALNISDSTVRNTIRAYKHRILTGK